jgi:hypothetical protein
MKHGMMWNRSRLRSVQKWTQAPLVACDPAFLDCGARYCTRNFTVSTSGAKPQDFPGYYDPMQVSAHKDAVSLFDRYSKSGDNSKLKDWAGKTLPTLQHHLQMVEDLKKRD